MSDSLQSHGLYLDFQDKNTGVGCYFLLQGIFLTQRLKLGLLHCRKILYHWATWEAHKTQIKTPSTCVSTFLPSLALLSVAKSACQSWHFCPFLRHPVQIIKLLLNTSLGSYFQLTRLALSSLIKEEITYKYYVESLLKTLPPSIQPFVTEAEAFSALKMHRSQLC